MPWLAETNFTVASGLVSEGFFTPFVHMIDETQFVMIFQAVTTRKIYAIPGDIVSDGSVTLHPLGETVEVADTPVTGGRIVDVHPLVGGGYWIEYEDGSPE